jgi:hypothetical protein
VTDHAHCPHWAGGADECCQCGHREAGQPFSVAVVATGRHEFVSGPQLPRLLVIGDPPQVTINLASGTIDYGPDYQPDEAARQFWDAVRVVAGANPIRGVVPPRACPVCRRVPDLGVCPVQHSRQLPAGGHCACACEETPA